MPIHDRDWYREEYKRKHGKRVLGEAPGEVLDPREVHEAQKEEAKLQRILDSAFPSETYIKKKIRKGKVALIVIGSIFLVSAIGGLLGAGQATIFLIQAVVGGALLGIGIKK